MIWPSAHTFPDRDVLTIMGPHGVASEYGLTTVEHGAIESRDQVENVETK